MILLIDNYDSFSYNLFQLVGTITPDIKVIRNDEIKPEEIEKLNPDGIIISPGPGKPSDAGICEDVIRMYAGRIPILGVCLGHQAICETFGAKVDHAKRLMHGKQSEVMITNDCDIFKGLDRTIKCARYHSLSAVEVTLPDCLNVIGKSTDDNEVMAVKHRDYAVYGLQFHPESILSPEGKEILVNFINITKNYKPEI